MAKKNSYYLTKEVLSVYKKEVSKSPDNLKHAFGEVAKQLGVSRASASTAWYSMVRDEIRLFKTKSKKKSLVNTKNVYKTKHYPSSTSTQEIVIRVIVEQAK